MSTPKDILGTDSPQVPIQDEDMPLYLREWRKYRGMTGPQLAELIGTQRSYISKWETGERPLRDINWITKLCTALQITHDQLRKMPPKSEGKLIGGSSPEEDIIPTADVAGPTEGIIEVLGKRADLHAVLEELPDELIDTAISLINRLKGAGTPAPRPIKRAGTK